MEERGGTIIERIARFAIQLVGAEEVERRIPEIDRKFRQMALGMQQSRDVMRELSFAFKELGVSISATTLQQLPQTTRFLEQYVVAGEKAEVAGRELTLTQYAQSQAGREAAESLGLIGDRARTLKQRFWDLNTTARALLRIFVAFKVIMGILGIFRDMGTASAELQAELWRLKATVRGMGEDIEGGAGTWENWLAMLSRLREILPYISMVEIAEGLRTITAIVGPLGLTRQEIETLTGLIGEMSLVVGQEFVPFAKQMITAVTGTGRAVASLNLDLRDGAQGMMDYAEQAGFVWDELNAAQRMYIRLAYATSEMAKRTDEVAEAQEQEFIRLREVQAARADVLAQSPELIKAQILWAEILLKTTEIIERLVGALAAWIEIDLAPWLDTAIKKTGAFLAVLREMMGMEPGAVGYEEFWERFADRLKMQEVLDWLGRLKEPWQEVDQAAEEAVEGLEESLLQMASAAQDTADITEEATDRINRALQQAHNALLSYQRGAAQAWQRLNRRLADIAENLERRLADLEARFEARRDQLIRRFEERRADIRQEAAEREEELREDLNKRLRRMEEDHLMEMQELREEYLLDLHEAARKRDAISMRRIQQRYILEKRQRERDYEVRERRAREDYEDQLRRLREARAEQERELEESLERELRELEENYQRQQEEARLNAEQQREDAQEDYRQRLQDLERTFQERLSTIISNLIYEGQEFEDAYGSLRSFFDLWYQGDLQTLADWLNERLQMMREAGLIEARAPIEVDWPPSGPRPGIPMAMGGFGLATGPTPIMVGEEGPEYFAAWRAGTKLPREAIDIRLTIDGTQQGAWSADFETQVLRVFRGVLEEVGL